MRKEFDHSGCNMHFDDILVTLGAFGLYQKRILYLGSLVAIPVAWHNVGSVFLAASMDHWCSVPNMANCTSFGACLKTKMMNIPSKTTGDKVRANVID